MNAQETAAWELDRFFRALGLPYAVIGGMAVPWWDEPHTTRTEGMPQSLVELEGRIYA